MIGVWGRCNGDHNSSSTSACHVLGPMWTSEMIQMFESRNLGLTTMSKSAKVGGTKPLRFSFSRLKCYD